MFTQEESPKEDSPIKESDTESVKDAWDAESSEEEEPEKPEPSPPPKPAVKKAESVEDKTNEVLYPYTINGPNFWF